MKKLLIIGPLPEPFGGVSVHIYRLSELMKSEYSISFIDESKELKPTYFNIYKLDIFGYFKRLFSADLIHIHSGNSLIRILQIILSKFLFKKVVVTIHSFGRKNKFAIKIDKFFINFADKIIVVNDLIKESLGSKSKIVVQYAFLPPIDELESNLSHFVLDFIHIKKSEGNKILIANAWRLDTYKNEDLYGLDMCINLAYDLAKVNNNVSFIFVISSIEKNNKEYLYYKERIKELKLQDVFLLINESLSFSKLISFSDIVLRPTNTDGDALTVREALYFDKIAIASDVVKRPNGTILFKNRDRESFFQIVNSSLNDAKGIKIKQERIDYKSIYLNIYKSCAE